MKKSEGRKMAEFMRACILSVMIIMLTGCGQAAGQDETSAFVSESVADVSETAADVSDAETDAALQTDADLSDQDALTEENSMIDSDNLPTVEGDIVLADLRGDSFLSARVAGFVKENPSYGIQYLAADQEGEADRILLETVNGEGPDILFLTRQDMESLQANGVLGDMGQLISQDTMEILLPGVIQMGTYEEKMVAVPLAVAVRTLLTSRDYWQEDTWTTEDILSVLSENNKLQGLFVDITGQDEFFYNMYFMLGIDIGNSPFIRDGNGSFESEEFRDILRLVKEMTQKADNNSTPYDRIAPLTEGNYLGVEYFVSSMDHFCKVFDKMGDSANLVGYPSDTGNHHYLSDYGMLVVNQNAMQKAGVKELINDLLSLESQQQLSYQISVRTDIPESQIAYNSAGKIYYWQSPNGNGFPLPAKEDGSSYLEEYLEFLNSAMPTATDSDDIFNMVMEEADSYFQADKDIDTVIDIIQRRVQLYLDEQK